MTRRPSVGQLAAAGGGVLLIVSLLLPWAEVEHRHRDGFQLLAGGEILLLTTGIVAIAAALTWKRYGLFRPDVSIDGAADLLALVATFVIAWFLLFDLPSGAHPEIGPFLALASTLAIMGGCGDYAPFRGAPWFPRIRG